MSKYKTLFIEESREHLAELSRLLVALEASDDPEPLIDEIFRHAHSIKGMAASMGHDPIVKVAHRMEDVVGERRNSKAAFGAAIVDLLLRCVDALTDQVECVDGDVTINAYDELVAAMAMPDEAVSDVADDKPAPAPTPAAAGSRTVVVELEKTSKAPGVRLFLVHKRLSELGSISESKPTVDAMRRGQVTETKARFALTSVESDEAIREALLGIAEVATVTVESVAATPAGPRAEATADGAKASVTLRVRTEILDTLIDNVGELFILRARLESLISGEAQVELRSALDSLSRQIREVHSQVMTVRMTPMHTLTDRYPRLVRDLARELGKEIELEIKGAEIEIDRAILDSLDEPIVHMLRNAVDHGIETPAQRQQAGKPDTGTLRIEASRDRDTVLLIIEDDGCGLDADALRAHAVEKGVVSAVQAKGLTARECYFLIFTPGFSTKSEVTGVSGRGVGMDAVRTKIESLGGSIDIESELGRRVRFVFRLPLTVAIINVLLVEAGKRLFAVPVNKVVAVRDAGEDTIEEAGGGVYMSFRHALAPVFGLADLLDISGETEPQHVVVIEDGRELIAVAVDRVVGYHEVVVKPLGDPLDRMEWFSGASILADGQPILILDLPKALRTRLAA